MMMSETRKRMDRVQFTVSLPEDGKVTGDVQITVNRDGVVHVSNVRNGFLSTKGSRYTVGIHVWRHPDGSWSTSRPDGEREHLHISRRFDADQYRKDDSPPKTHGAAIVAAVVAAVTEHVTAELNARGEYVDAYDDESRALRAAAEAWDAYVAARTVASDATRRREQAESAMS